MKNFLIYRSSAGSGKTYTLVKKYLKLVLGKPENVRHTLAITFTNKAADEMKTRIISSLKRLAEGKDPELLKQLKDEGVNSEIEASARYVLNYILHNYTYFSVSTIDSFFQKVIRSFSRELKLTIGYNVEPETGDVLDKVVDDVFRDIGYDEDITRYLVDFAYMNIDEDKGWHVDKNIKSLAGEIFKERYWEKKLKAGRDISDDRARINKLITGLLESRFRFENKLIKDASEALKIISSNGLEVEDFKYGVSGAAGFFRKLSFKENYSVISKIKPGVRPLNILQGKDEWYTGNSPKKSQIEKAINAGLGRMLEEIISFIEIQFTRYVTVRALLKTVYTVGIFGDIIKKLNEYRDINKTLLISDSNLLLKSVINEDSSPFVYEKTGDYYKNFLIDEFQDTSTFQWQNMLPLVLNSLSEHNFSMVAGDVKQSIYRWRNGNMKLLLRDIEKDLNRFSDNIQTEDLTTNYRSKANIVEFNNNLFEVLPAAFAANSDTGDTSVITEAYKNIRQKHLEKNPGGYVRAEFIPYEKGTGHSSYEKAGLRLTETVKELISHGVNPGDILILTRKKDELRDASMLLSSAGMQVVSDESLLLNNSPKVKFLVSIFRYISNRNDNFAKSEALYNYALIENNNIGDFDKIFRQTSKSFDALLEEKKYTYTEIQNRSIYVVTEYLLRIFGLKDKADLYLLRFLDVILEYSSSEEREISSFIPWWDENGNKYSIAVSGQKDAIRLMTIHKAKGLESPVVIIPYANWEININGRQDHIWVSSEEKPFSESSSYLVRASGELLDSFFAEDYNGEFILTNLDNLNLLYVALTRARERLYIISPQKGNKTKNINSVLQSVFESDSQLKELKTGNNAYEFGKKEKIKPAAEDKSSFTVNAIISSEFRKKAVVKPVHENLEFGRAKDYLNSKNRGIMLHKALSFITSAEDIDNAVNKIKSLRLLDERFEDELKKELTEIINDKNLAGWFDSGGNIKTEAEIITNNPERPVIRPDRVIINKNKVLLIDYKTGKAKEGDKRQLREYCDVLIKAGYSSIEACLYYIEDKKTVKVK